MQRASITIFWKGVGMYHPSYKPECGVGVSVLDHSTGEWWWYDATNPTLDRVTDAVCREWRVGLDDVTYD